MLMTPAFRVPLTFLMSKLSANIKNILSFASERTVILTVGNVLRRDDAVGPYIASRIASGKRLLVIDAGQNPEDFLDEIIVFEPKRIIIIDAADFGAAAGQIRRIEEEHISEVTVSTHSVPLKVITTLLAKDTSAKIDIIGIQVQNTTIGEGLSQKVKESAEALICQIQKECAYA